MKNNPNKQIAIRRHKNIKSGAGFTLLEVLIAISVFTIGLMGAMGLSFASYNDSANNLDRVVATNLAREGIELVRNLRDTNWLTIDSNKLCSSNQCTWDEYLKNPTWNGFLRIDYNDTFGGFKKLEYECLIGFVCYSGTPTDCTDCELYKDANGYYAHDIAATGTLTKYSRSLKVEKICVDESLPEPQDNEHLRNIKDACLVNEIYIGIRVASVVKWEDNGDKSVKIVNHLYNWRR